MASELSERLKRLAELQERLYAESQRSLLVVVVVVVQAMDTACIPD